jgi:two-component system LytT family response regulator
MNRIRSVIVDDEDLARERIRVLLADHADVEVAGEYANGADALRNLAHLAPDLLFLDVQMPGMDGFSLLYSLPEEQRPAVIFVTAYDEHAIRAFEADALDYLLKPFTKERFERALQRVRSRYGAGGDLEYRRRLSQALNRMRVANRFDRLPVKTENGTSFIRIDDVDWAEAEGNYMRVHAGRVSARLRETVENFCGRLPPERFIRIHRSIVLNIDRIVRVEPWAHGEYVVVLLDGTKLKSGRAYSESVRALLS